ncbi:MAG TPA: site-specific integrase [Galbitalea sp.]|jgi:integrase
MPKVETRELRRGGKPVGVRYVVRVRDPERGKYTSATYATAPEAEQFIRDCADRGVSWALAEYRRDKEAADEHTLNEWAEIHFDSITKANAATIARYRRIYRTHWSKPLGHYRLSSIGRVEVSKALNQVAGKDKTVLNAWGVLTHMLKMAAEDGLIPRSPTIGVRPSRNTAHEEIEHRYLSREEFWRVLDATPEHWKPLILTLAGTGMRWGELAALTVADVDPEKMTVSITKAEKQDPDSPGKVIIGPTKSKRSRRTVTLPAEVVEALEPLLDRPRSSRLFLPPKGGPLRHKTFYVDIWQKKCLGMDDRPGAESTRTIEDPQPRLHDLRHAHVAWLIAAGAPLPVIQARLGHEKITTTIDTYGHLLPDVQRAAAEAASLVLGSRPEPKPIGD